MKKTWFKKGGGVGIYRSITKKARLNLAFFKTDKRG